MGNPQEKHYRNIQVAKMAIERLHDYVMKLIKPDGIVSISQSETEKIIQLKSLIDDIDKQYFKKPESTKVDEEYISLLKESIKET